MKDNRQPDSVSSALDQELSRMAREVPEMPESFRQGWRSALRQEAAGASAPEKILPLTQKAPPASEPASAPAPGRRFPGSWRRGLSIAAVFLFLLGGTLLGQDAVSLTRRDPSFSISAPLPSPLSTASPTGPVQALSAAAPEPSADLAALPGESPALLTGSAAREAVSAKSAEQPSSPEMEEAEACDSAAEEEEAIDFAAEAPRTAESAAEEPAAAESEMEEAAVADSEADETPLFSFAAEESAAGDFAAAGSGAAEEPEAAETGTENRDAGAAAGVLPAETGPASDALSAAAAGQPTPPAWTKPLGIALVCLSFALAALLLMRKNRP